MAKGARNRRIRMQALALINKRDHKHPPTDFPGIEVYPAKTVARRIRRVGFIGDTNVKVW